MGKNRCCKNHYSCFHTPVNTEMIYGIIISHQYGIKIVTKYRKQGSYHTYLDPRPIINTIKKIKDILLCGKSQSNTNSIYNTIKMFVEEWILPQ